MRMRFFLCAFFLTWFLYSEAQKNQLSFRLGFQTERTCYVEDQTVSPEKSDRNHALNPGLETGIEFRAGKHWIIDAGIGFTNRKFIVLADFNQWAIPPPRQSPTNELVHARKVSYRIIEFPVRVSAGTR